jgi:hypothetical protein
MAKRTKNGATDPFITRRVGASHRKNYRHTLVPIARKGPKDNAVTGRELAEINKEYREKEDSLASAAGPHSTPEQSYPKSFFINQVPVKKQTREDS